ncbi:phage tail tube protein [Streptomyces malaysiensis]|uniref:phage tail tube protein n=1 Tax=Streptomyces malaysiensis TaxID=92644 RepID=UPI0036C1DF94
MANDAQKIRFAPNGGLYLAPAPDASGTGTVLPTAVGDGKTVPAGYQSFGYVDEGGVTITPSIETQPVNVWQSAVPVLYNVQSASFQIKATLVETNQLTSELFFGAPWVAVKDDAGNETGTYRLDLSSTPELKEVSLVVDWSQKGVLYRCVVPRAMISDRGAITLQRTEAQKYELTIDALDYNGNLGYVLTNDDILGTGGGPSPVLPFAAAVTVPGYATNDFSTAPWTAHVTTSNQTGSASVSLLSPDGTAFSTVQTLTADGGVDVTVPMGSETAEIKVNHGGVDYCFSVADNIQTGSSKTCSVPTG